MIRLPFRQVVAIVTFVAVLLCLAVIPLWQSLAQSLDSAHENYEHSLGTLQTSQAMMKLIHDAELGFIAFVGSGDNRYMAIHDRAVLAMPGMIEELASGHQHEEAKVLVSAIQSQWAKLDKLFKNELFNGNSLTRPTKFDYSSIAFADIAALEQKLQKLQKLEEREFREADALQHQKLNNAQIFVGFGLFSFGFLVFFLVYAFKKGLDRDIKTLVGHVSNQSPLNKLEFSDPQLATLEEALSRRDSLIEEVGLEKLQLVERHLQEQREFGAVLAHELKTPLTTLIGAIRSARFDGTLCTRKAQDSIENNAQTLVELIDSTLDYNELIQGRYQPKDDLVNLLELAKEAKDSVLKHWTGKDARISITTEFAPELMAHTDRGKVRQVLQNFLSNAIKFSPEMGEIKVCMSCSTPDEQDGEWLTIKVQDQGIGIGAEDIERIFEPFKQLNSGVNRKFVGTGLGLALSLEIAKSLKGNIDVKSIVGQGSLFTLRIPVRTEMVAKDLKQDTVTTEQSLDLSGLSALMVEDHPLNGKINAHLFKREFGCKVKIVTTGEAALASFEKGERFDFVLMDINLGEGVNGFETSRALNDLYDDSCPPIIALSAAIREGDEAELEAAGICGSIPKPFTKEKAVKELSPLFPYALKSLVQSPENNLQSAG